MYQTFSNGIKAQDEMKPVKEWAGGFLTAEVCSRMSEPPPKLSSTVSNDLSLNMQHKLLEIWYNKKNETVTYFNLGGYRFPCN